MKKYFLISVVTLKCIFSFAQNPGDSIFQSTVIHEINITFSQPDWWDSLMYYKTHSDSFNIGTQAIMGNVIIDGTLIDSVGVQLKGNSSFGYPGQKKSIKIKFNEFVPGKKYDRLKTIVLNNNTLDPTMMREKLALDFLNKKGLAAPRCTFAKVSYNGLYVGLYKLLEEVDKTFLKTHFGNNGGNLFKGDPGGTLMWQGSIPNAYYSGYELHTNTSANNWTDLVNLIDNINNTSASDFYDSLENNLNTNSFIRQWAARNLFVDLDAYYHGPHNYYLYHNTATDKFEWNTWDVSVSFGFYPFWTEDSTENTSLLMASANSPLTQRMLTNNTYKTIYLNTICEYLDYFSNAVLDQQIDSIAAAIYPAFVAEPDSNQMFPDQMFYAAIDTMTLHTPMGDIPGLKKFISKRRTIVLNELASLPFICSNGVKDLSALKSEVYIYPNPFSCSATLQISAGEITKYELKIFDMFGREVHPDIIRNSCSFRINRGNLPAGVYIYQLNDKEQFISSGKFIVQ